MKESAPPLMTMYGKRTARGRRAATVWLRDDLHEKLKALRAYYGTTYATVVEMLVAKEYHRLGVDPEVGSEVVANLTMSPSVTSKTVQVRKRRTTER